MQTVTQTRQVVTPVTPALQSPYALKLFEARSRTEIQSELNDMLLRTLKQAGCPLKKVGFVVGLLTAIGHSEPGEVVPRSRISIADRLPFEGYLPPDNETKDEKLKREAKRLKDVTSNLKWLKNWQRKIGKEFVKVYSGSPDASPEFCPHVTFLIEQAHELRKAKPEWRWNPNQSPAENAERRSAISEKAAAWVLSQLPASEPPEEEEETSETHLSLKEYHKRCLVDLERFVEKRSTHVGEVYFERPEILLEEMAQMLWKMAKAEKARRRTPPPDPSENAPMYKESTRGGNTGGDFERVPVFEEYEGQYESGFEPIGETTPEGGGRGQNWVYPPYLTSVPATKFDDLTCVRSPENGSDELGFEASAEANFWDPEGEAMRALDLNQSVGVEAPLEVTCLDDTPLPNGKRKAYWNLKKPGKDETRQDFGKWLDDALRLKASLIPRLMGSPGKGEGRVRPIFQIDDADRETAERLRPFSYWQVETSPGSYQSWHALSDIEGASEGERYREIETTLEGVLWALRTQGLKGNKGSSGSVRWPGSRNFKKEPDDRQGFPIQNTHGALGRFTTRAEFEAAGLWLSPPAPPPAPSLIPHPPTSPLVDPSSRGPDYGWEVEQATLRGSNRHGADQSWSIRAADWKTIKGDFAFSREHIEQRLYQLSDKAKELSNPGKYVATTVDNALRRVGRA